VEEDRVSDESISIRWNGLYSSNNTTILDDYIGAVSFPIIRASLADIDIAEMVSHVSLYVAFCKIHFFSFNSA